MNHILKKLSPLAIVFVALAGILTLTSTANAQSTARVQIKSGTDASRALSASGPRMVFDNNNDFLQRWDRDLVSGTSSTYKLARIGTLSCLRVASGAVSSTPVVSIVLGSCNGPRAQWRRTAASGAGDMLVNVETGHAMIQDLCFGGTCANRILGVPRADAGVFLPSDRNWTFELL